MKKLREINLSVGTSRDVSPHVKGKNPYFSGYSGGMNDSASSSYSSYMNSKKVIIDDEEESEEEIDIMPENILHTRIKKVDGKYSLNETLRVLNKKLLTEDAISDGFYSLITSIADDATAETGGVALFLVSGPKNLWELHRSNKKADAAFESGDIGALQEIRKDLVRDLGDFLSGLALAFPGAVLDDAVSAIIAQVKNPVASALGGTLGKLMNNLPGWMQKVIKWNPVAIGTGQPILFSALQNIDKIDSYGSSPEDSQRTAASVIDRKLGLAQEPAVGMQNVQNQIDSSIKSNNTQVAIASKIDDIINNAFKVPGLSEGKIKLISLRKINKTKEAKCKNGFEKKYFGFFL